MTAFGRHEPSLDDTGLPEGYPFQPDWEVTPRDVRDRLASDEEFLLIDCRLPQEWAIGVIDGAARIPVQQTAEHLEQLREHEDKPIVIYCHHGQRSLHMAAMLRSAGFEDVRSMAGGIDLWARDINPSLPRY